MSDGKKNNILTDEYLVGQVLQGDRDAFGIIIQNTEGLVAQIIFKMVANSEDRKDLVQDTYLKAYKNLPGFKFASKLSTWIGSIAYNACVNFLEKKQLILIDAIYEDESSSHENFENLYEAAQSNNRPEPPFFQKDLSKILASEIEKLPVLYKTLITLFHQEELSYAEIAQITQLPDGTVKNYLFRARKALKENLLRHYKKEDL